MKLCECGCGTPTRLAGKTNAAHGHIKGQPLRFISRHSPRGDNSPLWNGGRSLTSHGYVLIRQLNHPRVMGMGCVYEHILVAERALGHALPEQSCVHHVNEMKSDNANRNLVICEDDAYHRLLHRRAEAYHATSSVHALRCTKCQKWGFAETDNMHRVNRKDGNIGHSYHRACV